MKFKPVDHFVYFSIIDPHNKIKLIVCSDISGMTSVYMCLPVVSSEKFIFKWLRFVSKY